MIEKLAVEEEHELGTIVRALHDLCSRLDVPRPLVEPLVCLSERLVRTALARAKPNRRLPYLNQWRQVICWLPDAVDKSPAKDRPLIVEKFIRRFHLEDRRGKTKPGRPFPAGANCLLLRDSELWYARVPDEDMPQKVYEKPPPARLRKALLAGKQIYKSERVTSAVAADHAEYLEPVYPPGVLAREYQSLLRLLPREDPPDESSAAGVIGDAPFNLVSQWIKDGASRDDLAILVAARRAHLTAKLSNLTHLRETLRFAR